MRPEERRRHILELLRQRERISVDELARTLSTSQETIRRDLAALAEQGLVSKFHGGAALPPSGEHENAFQTRMNEHAQENAQSPATPPACSGAVTASSSTPAPPPCCSPANWRARAI